MRCFSLIERQEALKSFIIRPFDALVCCWLLDCCWYGEGLCHYKLCRCAKEIMPAKPVVVQALQNFFGVTESGVTESGFSFAKATVSPFDLRDFCEAPVARK